MKQDNNVFYTETRPWGSFINILVRENYKVKEIKVNPKQRLSYQSHSKRAEKWIVVEGKASVTLDDKELTLSPGDTVSIDVGQKHRVENKEDVELKFIEIQTGTYFGEDDIVRYSDDYGRVDNG